MLTIYGIYNSRAARTLWLADELGLTYSQVPVIQKQKLADPLAPGVPLNTGSPDFLAVNPTGFIPCIDDDGLVLHESMAINLYLARKAGGPLAPASAAEEAQMTMWSLYAATSVEPPALEITLCYRQGKQDDPVGRAILSGACDKLARPLGVLEAHLAKAGHLVGGRFTVADLNMAECLRYGQSHAPLLAPYPAVAAWLDKVQARPGFAAMMAKRAAE